MTVALRDLSPARFGPTVRLFLARRPWLRWLLVALVAALAALTVHDRMSAVDAARAGWGERRSVPVAVASAVPGEPLSWAWRDVPRMAVPDDVAAELSADAVARRHVGRGEIVVVGDVSLVSGPAAGADSGQVVVPIADPLVTGPQIGVDVAVYSDGLVLASAARIVHVDAEVVFVAVDEGAAPTVAAAARTQQASIVFLGPPDR